jgi:guanine deaminase
LQSELYNQFYRSAGGESKVNDWINFQSLVYCQNIGYNVVSMNKYMQLAIESARKGVESNQGGPFGAVVVCNGEVIAVAHNEVLGTNDPTAHAEVLAIRRASAKLGRFDLSNCEIYSTCEPCPMCLTAIHCAGIKTLYFGADRHDAAVGGFDAEFIYKLAEGTADSPLLRPNIVDQKECAALFHEWNEKADRTMY